jgi:hypothetical protein
VTQRQSKENNKNTTGKKSEELNSGEEKVQIKNTAQLRS